jgi:hypothetical protein
MCSGQTLIATSEWQQSHASRMPACAAFPLVFDAIVACISGFLALFQFALIATNAELHRLYDGQA